MNKEAEDKWIYIFEMHRLTLGFLELAIEGCIEKRGVEANELLVDSERLIVGIFGFAGFVIGSGRRRTSVCRYDNRDYGLRSASKY